MARSGCVAAVIALSCLAGVDAFQAPLSSSVALRRPHNSLATLSCVAKPPAPVPRGCDLPLLRHLPASVVSASALLASTAAFAAEEAADQAAVAAPYVPPGITTLDTGVFVAGCIPFVWAGISFWTRIVNGQPFGTGKDSVVIDTGREDWKAADGTGSSRILSAGALRLAYVLMGAAGVSVAAVFYAAQQLPSTLTPPS